MLKMRCAVCNDSNSMCMLFICNTLHGLCITLEIACVRDLCHLVLSFCQYHWQLKILYTSLVQLIFENSVIKIIK